MQNMCQVKILSILVIATIIVLVHQSDARPYRSLSRSKRISDQRLAELETLIALSRMKSKMVTIPVGFGRVDPLKIGRRKRAIAEALRNLLSDIPSQEDREDEMESDENDQQRRDEQKDLLNDLVYDDRQKIARYRHLPVRLPE